MSRLLAGARAVGQPKTGGSIGYDNRELAHQPPVATGWLSQHVQPGGSENVVANGICYMRPMRVANKYTFYTFTFSTMEKAVLESRIHFTTTLKAVSDAWDELLEALQLRPGGRIDLNALGDDKWMEAFWYDQLCCIGRTF
jgi:hypothetical protein